MKNIISCLDYIKGLKYAELLNGIIVFGGGKIGKIVTYLLELENVSVVACFDNDPNKEGKLVWDNIFCSKPRLISNNIPIFITLQNIITKKRIRQQCEILGYTYIYDIDDLKLYEYLNKLSDKNFLKLQYYLRMNGKILNLENPKTFNEKLQWLKLYYHNPDYTIMADKYEVKKYVSERIGNKYIIPTLGVWNHFKDINFEQLPNRFVLKCTHDSGSIFIIKNKEDIDIHMLENRFEKMLNVNYYLLGREWSYKNISPRIIAEEFLVDKDRTVLNDYKFMCFNGKVRCIFTCSGRFSKTGLKVTFYDDNWNKLPFQRHYPSEEEACDKPHSFEEMKKMAEKLTETIPFARIDFYEIQGQPYFGEITLYPGCGYEEFIPECWDETLGEWLVLPEPII